MAQQQKEQSGQKRHNEDDKKKGGDHHQEDKFVIKIFPAELEHQNEFKHFMEKKYTEQ